ncbi:MAG: hypothetical protein Q9175_006601 [Cornicularia normoerica]
MRGPIDVEIFAHPRKRDSGGISARSPDDVVPVEECKGPLGAATLFDEALYRRCDGDGGGEEDNGADGSSGEGIDGGNDNDDGDADNTHIASNSPQHECILTQMELYPMPNLGLCTFLSHTPPTLNPAPPVAPVPSPFTPQPGPTPASARVNAYVPTRVTPKRVIEARGLERLLAQSL